MREAGVSIIERATVRASAASAILLLRARIITSFSLNPYGRPLRLRIADCGLRIADLRTMASCLLNPQSEIRIPQSLRWPESLAVLQRIDEAINQRAKVACPVEQIEPVEKENIRVTT